MPTYAPGNVSWKLPGGSEFMATWATSYILPFLLREAVLGARAPTITISAALLLCPRTQSRSRQWNMRLSVSFYSLWPTQQPTDNPISLPFFLSFFLASLPLFLQSTLYILDTLKIDCRSNPLCSIAHPSQGRQKPHEKESPTCEEEEG